MSRIFDVRRSEGEPHDPLTELCDRMTRVLPDDVRAIILLDTGSERAGEGGMVAHGYDDDGQITQALRRHWRAWLQAKVGMPPEVPPSEGQRES